MKTSEVQLGKAPPEMDDEEFEEGLVFSPNGQRVAYCIPCKNGYKIVIDGDNLTFSPDSKSLAYLARLEQKRVLVMNREESEM